MATANDHLAHLLAKPIQERARAARILVESLDDGPPDPEAVDAQSAELTRRMQSLENGTAELVDGAEVKARITKRLRAIRGQ